MRKFKVYGQQTTDFTAIVEAETLEEANQIASDGDADWDECGELGWVDLPEETEEIKDANEV